MTMRKILTNEYSNKSDHVIYKSIHNYANRGDVEDGLLWCNRSFFSMCNRDHQIQDSVTNISLSHQAKIEKIFIAQKVLHYTLDKRIPFEPKFLFSMILEDLNIPYSIDTDKGNLHLESILKTHIEKHNVEVVLINNIGKKELDNVKTHYLVSYFENHKIPFVFMEDSLIKIERG